MDHKAILLTELIDKAKKQMDLLGYAESTKNRYAGKWKHFLFYAEQKGQTYFSKELGEAFLKDRYGMNYVKLYITHLKSIECNLFA